MGSGEAEAAAEAEAEARPAASMQGLGDADIKDWEHGSSRRGGGSRGNVAETKVNCPSLWREI